MGPFPEAFPFERRALVEEASFMGPDKFKER